MLLQFWKAGIWVLTRETSSALSETKWNLRWLLAKSREGKSHLRNSCVLLIAACNRDKSVVLPEEQDVAPFLSKSPSSLTFYCGSNKDLRWGVEAWDGQRKLRAKPHSLCAISWWALQTILKHQVCQSTKAVLYKASCSSSGGVSTYYSLTN